MAIDSFGLAAVFFLVPVLVSVSLGYWVERDLRRGLVYGTLSGAVFAVVALTIGWQ